MVQIEAAALLVHLKMRKTLDCGQFFRKYEQNLPKFIFEPE